MAKNIVVHVTEGAQSAFRFSKLVREDLYGKKSKVVVDEHGGSVQTAYLTQDGSAVVPTGGTAMLYVDDTFRAYEVDERQAADREGQPLQTMPSTLDVSQQGMWVTAERVLDCVVDSVYLLQPESIDGDTDAELKAGRFLELPYSYRGGADMDRLFIVRNDQGYFGLVCHESGFMPLSRVVIAVDDDEEDTDTELDFTMM